MIGGFAFAAANFDHIDNLFEFVGSFACGSFATYVSVGVSVGVGAVVGGAVTAGVGAIGVSVGSPVIAAAAPFIGAGVGAAAGYLTYNLTYSALTGTPFNFSWKDMGIEMGIAVATVGVCTVASKLASKSSKIMQTRHRPTATNPDEIAAMAESKAGPKYVNKGETINWDEYPDHIIGTQERVTVNERTVIDRFSEVGPEGNYNFHLENGTYFSEPGTPYVNRSIPRNPADGFSYGQWEIVKPIQADKSLIGPMPQYNLPGGGVQYRFINPKTGNSYMNVHQLQEQGFIRVFQKRF